MPFIRSIKLAETFPHHLHGKFSVGNPCSLDCHHFSPYFQLSIVVGGRSHLVLAFLIHLRGYLWPVPRVQEATAS